MAYAQGRCSGLKRAMSGDLSNRGTATLGQIDARLTEIDNILLRADVGEVYLGTSERSELEAEAEAILKLLAEELGKRRKIDPREAYEMRNEIRQLNYVAAITERYSQAHPEPNPENDRIIAEAVKGMDNGTKTQEEAGRMIASIYTDMFVPSTREERLIILQRGLVGKRRGSVTGNPPPIAKASGIRGWLSALKRLIAR